MPLHSQVDHTALEKQAARRNNKAVVTGVLSIVVCTAAQLRRAKLSPLPQRCPAGLTEIRVHLVTSMQASVQYAAWQQPVMPRVFSCVHIFSQNMVPSYFSIVITP